MTLREMEGCLREIQDGRSPDPDLVAAQAQVARLKDQAVTVAAGVKTAQETVAALELAAQDALLNGEAGDESRRLVTAQDAHRAAENRHVMVVRALTESTRRLTALHQAQAARVDVTLRPIFEDVIGQIDAHLAAAVALEQILEGAHHVARVRLGAGHALAQGYAPGLHNRLVFWRQRVAWLRTPDASRVA